MHMRISRITEWRDLVQTERSPASGTERKATQIGNGRGARGRARHLQFQKLKVAKRSMRRLAVPFEKGPHRSAFGRVEKLRPQNAAGIAEVDLI